jgi:ferredoxin-thioredoxin reductase catalytic subunit
MVTIESVEQRARRDARQHGIYLTPDTEQLQWLLEGLKANEERYGYPSCPCRLASGQFELDRDIICPCDYRDPDVVDYGTCYCNLYVDEAVYRGDKQSHSIPERRPPEKQLASINISEDQTTKAPDEKLKYKSQIIRTVLYCRQCGYMVFREEPPYICPICQAKQEMFEVVQIVQRSFNITQE